MWGKFRRELKLFERFEVHSRMLGWDESGASWSTASSGPAGDCGGGDAGLFRGPKGTVAPAEFARELGVDESPALPGWLQDWSASCDGLSEHLREAEAPLR